VSELNFESLIDAYWCLAYKEGEQGRTHDTKNGDAQRVLSDITSYVGQLRQQLAELNTSIDDLVSDALVRSARVRDLEAHLESGEAVGEVFGTGVNWVRGKAPEIGAKLYTHPAPVVPMIPYLKNRADAVDGHYCIARLTNHGYSEFWNEEAGKWCGAGSVFNLGKAMLSAAQEKAE
jgi:hypothetical protein